MNETARAIARSGRRMSRVSKRVTKSFVLFNHVFQLSIEHDRLRRRATAFYTPRWQRPYWHWRANRIRKKIQKLP